MLHFSKDGFDKALSQGKLMMVDFWADWCGPCRMLSPVLDELAAEETGIKFCKVNVDEEPGLAAQFGVNTIPTLLFSKNGTLTGRTVGFRPKAELQKLIDQNRR